MMFLGLNNLFSIFRVEVMSLDTIFTQLQISVRLLGWPWLFLKPLGYTVESFCKEKWFEQSISYFFPPHTFFSHLMTFIFWNRHRVAATTNMTQSDSLFVALLQGRGLFYTRQSYQRKMNMNMQMKPIISNLPRPVQETQQHLTEGNGCNYVKCQREGPMCCNGDL